MNLKFINFFEAYGKIECECSMSKTECQVIITMKSVKMECLSCHRVAFYRRLGDMKNITITVCDKCGSAN